DRHDPAPGAPRGSEGARGRRLRRGGPRAGPRSRQRHPGRDWNAGVGHPPGRAARTPDLATRAGRGGGRIRHGRGRRPADRRLLRRLAGGLVPRPFGERRGRADRQQAGPRRLELRGGRRLRQLARRGEPGAARAGLGPLRRRPLRRARHLQRHLHVHVLQQDPGALADGRCEAFRRRRRRHDPGRRAGDAGAEAAGRRRARRRPDLRRDPIDGLVQRRRRPGDLRPQGGRTGQGAAAGLRAGRDRAGDHRPDRGPRHGDPRRRRHRGPGAGGGLPGRGRGGPVVRPGVGEVPDRPHQGGGGRGGA
ncbi:hypothetical protein HK102_011723, partial [Quaeritorhiza haematococci]